MCAEVLDFISYQRNTISKVKSPEKPNVSEAIKQLKMSSTAGGSVEWHAHFREQLARFLSREQHLFCDPPIPPLVINPWDMKTHVHRLTRERPQQFYSIAKNRKNANGPQQDNGGIIAAYSHNGTSLSDRSHDCCLPSVDQFHRHGVEWKRPDPKSTDCVIPFIWWLKAGTSNSQW